MAIRFNPHAGTWYKNIREQLAEQLDGFLDAVPDSTTPIGTASSQQGDVSIPTPNARAIIAPHAGYRYSGAAAAWAYKSADWANAKRVFILGPSHHYYLTGAATSCCARYATPLGYLTVDTALVSKIAEEWSLEIMAKKVEEAEHSLELQLPYIYRMLSLHNDAFKSDPTSVQLVPIMVGNTEPATEAHYGACLAPYLTDPTNIFVISSDFCHWGTRFRYSYYQPADGSPGIQLRFSTPVPRDYPIHKSIAAVDKQSMDAIESGSHKAFLEQLKETGNTVCGRHPIGVFMAAVEALREDGGEGKGRFKFVRYERSELVQQYMDTSVSYASAFAVL